MTSDRPVPPYIAKRLKQKRLAYALHNALEGAALDADGVCETSFIHDGETITVSVKVTASRVPR